jgi:hypothetical protein
MISRIIRSLSLSLMCDMFLIDADIHCSIYIELAEQYGLMDAASNVSIRNVLAEHLREVIDILVQKVRNFTQLPVLY